MQKEVEWTFEFDLGEREIVSERVEGCFEGRLDGRERLDVGSATRGSHSSVEPKEGQNSAAEEVHWPLKEGLTNGRNGDQDHEQKKRIRTDFIEEIVEAAREQIATVQRGKGEEIEDAEGDVGGEHRHQKDHESF